MSATLKLTDKAIGAEVPLRHLRCRGRRSTQTFDAAGEETVAFRCTGKRFLPIFLASFVAPRPQ
jgi:hypothetical protein